MKIAASVCAVILSAAMACAQTVPSLVIPLTRVLGVVGIGGGQTLRLNALNPGVSAPALGVRCTANLSFVNDQGQTLKSSTVTVDPDKSLWLDLNRDTDVSATTARVEIHALVSVPPVGRFGGYCTIVPTLELIDNGTGRTTAVLTDSSIRSQPIPLVQPNPPATTGSDQP